MSEGRTIFRNILFYLKISRFKIVVREKLRNFDTSLPHVQTFVRICPFYDRNSRHSPSLKIWMPLFNDPPTTSCTKSGFKVNKGCGLASSRWGFLILIRIPVSYNDLYRNSSISPNKICRWPKPHFPHQVFHAKPFNLTSDTPNKPLKSLNHYPTYSSVRKRFFSIFLQGIMVSDFFILTFSSLCLGRYIRNP